MSLGLRNLTSLGWRPGDHIGLPQQRRPFHMTELADLVMAESGMGEVTYGSSEWVGLRIPLAIDTDGDGVDDQAEVKATADPTDPRMH